jgi:hypothetical protein
MDLANLEIKMEEADRLATLPLKVQSEGNKRTMHDNAWKTYRERDSKLQLCRGKAFLMLLGQCTLFLTEKLKQAVGWDTVSVSYDPLQLIALIEDGAEPVQGPVLVCNSM